jgi:hypothetical protein
VKIAAAEALPRFAILWAAGALGSAAAGALAFGSALLQPGRHPFLAVTTGVLVAGVFAAVRTAKTAGAVALVTGWAALHLGASLEIGWPAVVARPGWCLGIGLGACLAAVVFHQLAERGYRFGKFLITGPMMGGIWVAATPVFLLGGEAHDRLLAEFLMSAFLGLLVGDGAGFGVETAEWALRRADRSSAT